MPRRRKDRDIHQPSPVYERRHPVRSCRAQLLCHVPKGMLMPPNPSGEEATRTPSSIPPTQDPELIMTARLAGRVTPAVAQARDSRRGAGRAGGLGRRWPRSRRAAHPQTRPRCITAATACQWQLTGMGRRVQLPHLAGGCGHSGPGGAAPALGREAPLNLGPELGPPTPLGVSTP